MRKNKRIHMRLTEGELFLLKEAAGDGTMSKVLMDSVRVTRDPDMNDYPGWEVREQGKNFVLISKEPVPLGRKSPVLLVAGDAEYDRLAR